MPLEVFLTKDQSHTLYVPELDETYHSRNGALEEALYVYIGKGLSDRLNDGGFNQPSPLNILEIGFGTGLNTWLTALKCSELGVSCCYHTLETLPLGQEVLQQLNYIENAVEADVLIYGNIHKAPWTSETSITPYFTLQKFNIPLQEFIPSAFYDVIYFDAFAPEKQPELWTQEIFRKLYKCLQPGGIIVTYSSKGDIKRMWKEIGFEVERLPGPPMKRHMLRGRKKARN